MPHPSMPDASSPRTRGAADLPAGARVLFDRDAIRAAVDRLGADVRATYGDDPLTVVAVLHGALVFTADLIRRLDMPVQLETVTARSYRGDATTPGDLELRLEDAAHLTGRHVLVVDDILDTGRTLARLTTALETHRPASLRRAVLLDKPSRRVEPVTAEFVGLEVPDLFVVGYGLDHDGRWRNLPDIHALPT